jgi:prepilin-type N-terminal cleavage/methylation domain-containing protein
MSSVIHMVHGLNSRLELCGQWVLDHLHISRVRENLKKSRKVGFTLVELMVVVAVIAILAAIAMPQFLSAADRARNAKETADIQIIKNATQLYMIDKNVDTPPTVENLYKEGYLTEHVKTAKDKEYTITYEVVNGGTAKAVVVKAPDAP